MLLSLLGDEGQPIVSTFGLDARPSSQPVNVFMALENTLERHFEPSVCIVLERKKFCAQPQEPEERV